MEQSENQRGEKRFKKVIEILRKEKNDIKNNNKGKIEINYADADVSMVFTKYRKENY